MQRLAEGWRCKGKSIGFVPTMGAFHEGHLSLIRKSVKQNDITVVSIFVNPAQFGANEDFARYPKSFKSDYSKARQAGADVIFYPSLDSIYPADFQTYVTPGSIADRLEGAARPGHMRGVATVCVKFFNIVRPHRAYFGQKDAQQLAVIKQVVKNLNLDLKIVRCPIVRTKSGIALSSRHAYLSKRDLKKAEAIYDSLKLAKRLIDEGETNAKAIKTQMTGIIQTVPGVEIEYIAFNRWDDLTEIRTISGKTLISMAAIVNKVRLLDNIIVNRKI